MITIYSHKSAPNGWKVAIILEELGIQYETKYLEFGDDPKVGVKGPEHVKHNPNGRIPTIIDHDNNDFTLWESNSIIKYLVERYDKENKIHYPSGTNEAHLVDQWMTFQVSGQGPYYGQITWFKFAHSEKVPSAVERYQKEALRVISVLDSALSKGKYLVGDKLTIADIVFYPWNYVLVDNPNLVQETPLAEELKKYKNFWRWHEEIGALETVKKVYGVKSSLQ